MDPITATLIIGGCFVAVWAAIYLWPYMLHVVTMQFIPFVRSKLGDNVANKLADLIAWVDNPVCALRSKMLQIATAFKASVLGIRETYEKTSATQATRTTEQTFVAKGGEVMQRTVVEEVNWEDIPAECRKVMMQQNMNKATLDIKDGVEKRIDQALAQAEAEALKLQV